SNCSMVQDFNPGGDIDTLALGGTMLSHNGILYLMGNNGVTGREMCKYDGTTMTAMSDIFPGIGSSNAAGFTVLGDKIYFRAQDTIFSEEIWGYNLQTGVTAIVHDEPTANGFPMGFTIFNNKFYFSGFDANVGHELRCYNPQGNSYTLIQDINPGFFDAMPGGLVVVNGKLYFFAKSDTHGREIYEYTGTGTPTRLTDINPGTADGVLNSTGLNLYNNAFYFNGNSGTADSLFKYDLQTGNISVVYNKPGRDFEIFGGKLYFTAEYSPYGKELCVYDGNTVSMVQDLNPGAAGSDIWDKTIYNNEMYFMAITAATGAELYKLTDAALAVPAVSAADEITIYPNPAGNQLNVTSGVQISKLEVFSVTGQLLVSEMPMSRSATVDISGLASGVYLVKVNGEVKKLVVE
ncbi:MAG TPA: T9SS type A sorting domain-containing protein, partial [Flavipsychrobacter sp.]|nr:T9SS type A sorting domain-containing protein [Flavipsychrobacter sp.]